MSLKIGDGVKVRGVSRRAMLRAALGASAATAGAAILAACGETQVVEKIVTKEVVVEKVVEVIVEVPVEAPAAAPVQAGPVQIRFATDHTSGPRGNAMNWAMRKFAEQFPHIFVKREPTGAVEEAFALHVAAGDAAELTLSEPVDTAPWYQEGAFTRINDTLEKHADWDPLKWLHQPDEYSVNFWDEQPSVTNDGIQGPQYGMPYQGAMIGPAYNTSMMDRLGIAFPEKGKWGVETEFLEALKQATNPDTGEFGMWMHSFTVIWWIRWAWGLSDTGTRMIRNPEGTHYEVFEDGGDRGYSLAIDMIHKHEVAPTTEGSREVAGEFANPFASGKVLVGWHLGFVGSNVIQIGNRFNWALGPVTEGPRGPMPVWHSGQPHIVSNSAERNGTTEETVELALFMAGPTVQNRIGVDRGSAPVLKSVYDEPDFHAGPPDNHGTTLKEYSLRDDHRGWQAMHPNASEWRGAWSSASDKGFLGEETAEESIESVIAASDRILADRKDEYDEMKAWGRTL